MESILTRLWDGWHFLVAGLQSGWELVEAHSKDWGDTAIAIFTVVLALATVQLARATNVLADDTRKNARQREIQNAISAGATLLSALSKAAELSSQSAAELPKEAIEALNECESIAIGARIGLHNLTILNQFAGVGITVNFGRLLPKIEELRSRIMAPQLYAELEWLARQTENRIHKSCRPCEKS